MINRFTKIVIFFVLVSSFIIAPSCDRQNQIPYVYVNIVIYPDLPEYSSIKTPGNYLYLTGGVKGIVLYCQFTDNYLAYERNCPNDPYEKNAILEVDSSGLFLVCKQCKSKFFMYDGGIADSPSKYPVLRYATYFENNTLYIQNGD